ncbi:MAG: DUF433 domain-containing protein [Deltaproteobacteria bacterium]|nr:DUF433 domain-containing protein [Deltaproteobacteria bacterium]
MTRAQNLKEEGAYTPTEAAHYLRVPISTLRTWIFGQDYKASSGNARRMRAVIKIADGEAKLLSFYNLVEIHVLAAFRRVHEIPLPKIRTGLEFVEKKLNTNRPLLNQNFLTDGLDIFVEKSGLLLNVTQGGQAVIRTTVEQFLKRIERDTSGIPIKLFPFSRHAGQEDTKSIVIDPRVSFGRPVLIGTSVPTVNVFERFLAGEPIEELAEDFRVEKSLIEEAIRCEQVQKTVA